MTRRLAAWLLSVPLMIGGTEAAHWLVFRVVYPDPYVRAQALAQSGHGYLAHWTSGAAVLGALALAGFGARVLGPRLDRERAVSLLPFLALAPLTFVLQETVERIATGGLPFEAILTPTFLPGLALQIPFALVTYLLARLLLGAADRIQIWFDSPLARAAFYVFRSAAFSTSVDLPRLSALSSGHGLRGPPLAAACA
jgi:hypothetical protein